MDVSVLIQAYSKDPLNQYVMEDFDVSEEQYNSVCGDMIIIYLKIDEGDIIKEYSHSGAPQMFTLAAASLLAEEIVGKHIEQVLEWNYEFMRNLGFEVSPRRRRSAVSALLAVRNAIHKRQGNNIIDTYDDLL